MEMQRIVIPPKLSMQWVTLSSHPPAQVNGERVWVWQCDVAHMVGGGS